MPRLFGLAFAALILAAGPAGAQTTLRDLCPDRPGKGSPPCILDVGHLQAEIGLADLQRDRQSGVTTDSSAYGDLELRAGLTPRLEAQLAWSPALSTRQRTAGVTTRENGVGDLALALRASLRNPDGQGLSIALQPYVSAPTATRGFGAGGWEGGLIVPMSLPLTPDLAVAFSPELDVVRDSGGRGTHLAWSAAAGVGHGFGPVQVGIELWAGRDDDPSGAVTQASLDLMAAWSPNDDLQLDLGLNAGLNRDTPDLEIYAGLARRF